MASTKSPTSWLSKLLLIPVVSGFMLTVAVAADTLLMQQQISSRSVSA